MSIMYLAKINLTKGIFDVYDKKINIEDVKETIYNRLSDNILYNTITNMTYRDSMGNKSRVPQKSSYGITELKKLDDKIMTGKVVRTFERATEQVVNGKVTPSVNQENVSIYFYFDVNAELIAFSERQSFGYNQFMRAFEYILNRHMEGYRFEIFLQKDNNILQEKIRGLAVVKSFKATLIPPNSNEEDLEELRNSLHYIADCKETNANKLRVEMTASDDKESSLKMESKYMQDIMKAVSRGYGDITTYGINKTGKKQIISSNSDAALTRVIDENMGEYGYNEEAKGFITDFLSGVFRLRNQGRKDIK